MKRPKPGINDGAELTRTQISRHIDATVRRLKKLQQHLPAGPIAAQINILGELKAWISEMPERAAKRAGGAGRK